MQIFKSSTKNLFVAFTLVGVHAAVFSQTAPPGMNPMDIGALFGSSQKIPQVKIGSIKDVPVFIPQFESLSGKPSMFSPMIDGTYKEIKKQSKFIQMMTEDSLLYELIRDNVQLFMTLPPQFIQNMDNAYFLAYAKEKGVNVSDYKAHPLGNAQKEKVKKQVVEKVPVNFKTDSDTIRRYFGSALVKEVLLTSTKSVGALGQKDKSLKKFAIELGTAIKSGMSFEKAVAKYYSTNSQYFSGLITEVIDTETVKFREEKSVSMPTMLSLEAQSQSFQPTRYKEFIYEKPKEVLVIKHKGLLSGYKVVQVLTYSPMPSLEFDADKESKKQLYLDEIKESVYKKQLKKFRKKEKIKWDSAAYRWAFGLADSFKDIVVKADNLEAVAKKLDKNEGAVQSKPVDMLGQLMPLLSVMDGMFIEMFGKVFGAWSDFYKIATPEAIEKDPEGARMAILLRGILAEYTWAFGKQFKIPHYRKFYATDRKLALIGLTKLPVTKKVHFELAKMTYEAGDYKSADIVKSLEDYISSGGLKEVVSEVSNLEGSSFMKFISKMESEKVFDSDTIKSLKNKAKSAFSK